MRLTPKELDVLRYLALHANKVVPHRELLQAVWGPDYGDRWTTCASSSTSSARRSRRNPSNPAYLLTEPWVGYRLQLSASP